MFEFKALLPLLPLGLALGFTSPADASFPSYNNTGYVCSVYYNHWRYYDYYGDFGAVAMTVYSGPGCSGSFVGSGTMYSRNTDNSWVYDDYRISNAEALAAEAQMLQQAMLNGQRVTVQVLDSHPSHVFRVRHLGN